MLFLSFVWLFCDPMNCSPPGSFVHGISQASILEWDAISFSRRSCWPRDWTWVSCIADGFFTMSHKGSHWLNIFASKYPSAQQIQGILFYLICIWLHQVLVSAGRIFSGGMWALSCSMWGLVSWSGIKPRPLHRECRVSHWATREVPKQGIPIHHSADVDFRPRSCQPLD